MEGLARPMDRLSIGGQPMPGVKGLGAEFWGFGFRVFGAGDEIQNFGLCAVPVSSKVWRQLGQQAAATRWLKMIHNY